MVIALIAELIIKLYDEHGTDHFEHVANSVKTSPLEATESTGGDPEAKPVSFEDNTTHVLNRRAHTRNEVNTFGERPPPEEVLDKSTGGEHGSN